MFETLLLLDLKEVFLLKYLWRTEIWENICLWTNWNIYLFFLLEPTRTQKLSVNILSLMAIIIIWVIIIILIQQESVLGKEHHWKGWSFTKVLIKRSYFEKDIHKLRYDQPYGRKVHLMEPVESSGNVGLIPCLQRFQAAIKQGKQRNVTSWQVQEPQDILGMSRQGIHSRL